MIRMSKLTDYGFVVLSRFTEHGPAELVNAPDLAAETGLPLPTVSKLLKVLTRHGLLAAHRGVKGGYSLARSADSITAVEVIEALEGPIAFTDCTAPETENGCAIEHQCRNKSHWHQITEVVRSALQQVSLRELAGAEAAPAAAPRAQVYEVGEKHASNHSCGTGACSGDGPACTCSHDMTQLTRGIKR
jgi:FeS assembly SUF system regulator